MSTIELPVFPDAELLTHSGEQAWKTCPRKYYLQYRLGLRPKHDSDALRLGSAFHVGLEELKNGGDEAQAERAVRLAYADADCPPWLQPDDFDVEQSFAVPIINPTTGRRTPCYLSAGKIDGIVELPDGRLAIMEHKTTSDSIEPGSDYWARLLMDSQLSRYMLAARAMGYAVETSVYDVTRKPSIRPKAVTKADRALATSQGHYFDLPLTGMCPERETPRMFGARLLADLVERPDFYFARNEVPRLDADLAEFTAEQWIVQKSIRDSEIKEQEWGASAWPRNTGACLSPYRCQFFSVCRGLCGEPTDMPEGFKRAERLHPELGYIEGAE